ncbi:MAG TPA: O-antigen ligase family protein [Lacipirellulaceae bacterium]|nr:O-antigen ligase family protein [Lacipirellulaceae bacterium]
MRSGPVLPLELIAAPRGRWDVAIETLLAVLLAFMPAAFGAVDAWSELIAVALAGLLALGVACRAALSFEFRLMWTWAYVPLVGFAALVAVQLLPLPAGVTGALSPAAVATRADLLAPAALPPQIELSMYPHATAHMLRIVLVGLAVFFATFNAIRTPEQVKRLLLIVFAIGCAEAALALLQIVGGAEGLYWTVDVGVQRPTSGSFVNYSNFSQFMNLSIGAGLALLLVRMHEEQTPLRFTTVDPRAGSYGTLRTLAPISVANHGILLAGLILAAIAVLASLSRNGAISLVVAGLAMGAALFARGILSRRGWVLAVLPLGILAVLLLFGFDMIYERLATLGQKDALQGRWTMTAGALRAWKDFPLVGVGLGCHEFVFSKYDPTVAASLAAHVDNDYAELLEETGLLGVGAVAWFLAILGIGVFRLCRQGATPLAAAGFGALFALVAVMVHSASDFGQRIPAVFCLTAVTSAVVLRVRILDAPSAPPAGGGRGPRRCRMIAAGAALAITGAWFWALAGAYASHLGEQWWWAANQVAEEIQDAGPMATADDYANLLAAAEQAVHAQPADAAYAYMLNLFRWQSIAGAVGQQGQAGSSAARPIVARIADALAQVRTLCPTYGPPYALEGQLRLLVLEQPAGRDLIAKALALAPYDGPTCLIAGQLAARDGEADSASTLLARAVALAPWFYRDAIATLVQDLDRPDLARRLAEGNIGRVRELARLVAASPQHAHLAAELEQDADAALRSRAADGSATAGELSELALREASSGRHLVAAELYFRALQSEYNRVEWRLARAQSLIAAGEDEQALREVRICLRLSPDHALARQLADELSLRVE